MTIFCCNEHLSALLPEALLYSDKSSLSSAGCWAMDTCTSSWAYGVPVQGRGCNLTELWPYFKQLIWLNKIPLLKGKLLQIENVQLFSDGALEQGIQRGGGIASSGDSQGLSGCGLDALCNLLEGACLNRGLDLMISRGSFQPLQFCDSVKMLFVLLFPCKKLYC